MTEQQRKSIAQQFAEHFETERRLTEYQDWSTGELVKMEESIQRLEIQTSMRGMFTREEKKKLRSLLKNLKKQVKTGDPRYIPSEDITRWLMTIGFFEYDSPGAVINEARSHFRRIMDAAVEDADSFKDLGLTPFLLDAERSSRYMMVKTPEQYQMDRVRNNIPGTESYIKGQQKKHRKVSSIQEGYGGESEDITSILSVSHGTSSIILSLTAELKPILSSICAQKDRLDSLEQKNKEEFAEFIQWKQEQVDSARDSAGI